MLIRDFCHSGCFTLLSCYMRSRSGKWVLGALLFALVGTLWSLRGMARDLWFESHRPTLPPATSFIVQPSSSTGVVPSMITTTTPRVIPTVPFVSTTNTTVISSRAATSSKISTPRVVTHLPESVNLHVPFLSQAPNQVWSMPYQEACEEASLIMVDAYLRGRTKSYPPSEGDERLLDLIAHEVSMGLSPDLTAHEIEQVVNSYYSDRRVDLMSPPSIERIRASLAAGFPVIIPASGKALGNPNFRNGGPLYHMLVIKGYLSDGRWITNDPGTRRGADYIYDQDVLMQAIHDWNGGDVTHGTPIMIVVKPK